MFKNLEAEMTRFNVRQQDLADLLHITLGTMNLKMNGKARLTLDEAQSIREFMQTKTDKYLSVDYLFKK